MPFIISSAPVRCVGLLLILSWNCLAPAGEESLAQLVTSSADARTSVIADAVVPLSVASGTWSLVTELRSGLPLAVLRRTNNKPSVLIFTDGAMVLNGPQGERQPMSKPGTQAIMWDGQLQLGVTRREVINAADGSPIPLPAAPATARVSLSPVGASQDGVVVVREVTTEALDGTKTTIREWFAIDSATKTVTRRELTGGEYPVTAYGTNASGFALLAVKRDATGQSPVYSILDLSAWTQKKITGTAIMTAPDGAAIGIDHGGSAIAAKAQLVAVRGAGDYPARKPIGSSWTILTHQAGDAPQTMTRLYGRWINPVPLGGGLIAVTDDVDSPSNTTFIALVDAVRGRLVGSALIGATEVVKNQVRVRILTAWQDGKNAYVYVISPTRTGLTLAKEHLACLTIPMLAAHP